MATTERLEKILGERGVTIDKCSAGLLGQVQDVAKEELLNQINKFKTESSYQLRISGKIKIKKAGFELEYTDKVHKLKGEGINQEKEYYIEFIRDGDKSEVYVYVDEAVKDNLSSLISLLERALVPAPAFNYRQSV
jgi:hypothetical protein